MREAAMTQHSSSPAASFWNFLDRNPKKAAEIAFQVGVVAGEISRLLGRNPTALSRHFVDMVPADYSAKMLEYLPGASAKAKPRRPPRKRPKR
jgi:hypothetical protein